MKEGFKKAKSIFKENSAYQHSKKDILTRKNVKSDYISIQFVFSENVIKLFI